METGRALVSTKKREASPLKVSHVKKGQDGEYIQGWQAPASHFERSSKCLLENPVGYVASRSLPPRKRIRVLWLAGTSFPEKESGYSYYDKQ